MTGVQEQLNEMRGPDDLRTGFLQSLKGFDADGVRGVELRKVDLQGRQWPADGEQIRNLHIGEAPRYTDDMPSGLIRDVDAAFHVGRFAQCNRRAIGKHA